MKKQKERYIIPMKERIKDVSKIVAGIAGVFLLMLLASNFVIDGQFIVRGAVLNIQGAPTGTHILLDSKLAGEVNSNGSLIVKRIKPGQHTLIATKNAHWPWVKGLETQAGESINLIPLFIPQEIIGKIVEDAPATLNFANTRIQGLASNIWASGAAIYIQDDAATQPVAVFTADYPVRALALYPSRTDTLLVAAGDLIFALDIAQTEQRNFLPVYKSAQPTFAIDKESGTIFVKDGEQILQLILQ